MVTRFYGWNARVSTRRIFLEIIAAAGLWSLLPNRLRAIPLPVRRVKSQPYESLFAYIEAGHDEFASEKRAAEISAHLERLPQTRSLPLSSGFQGGSPLPVRHHVVADGIFRAEFDTLDRQFEKGLAKWLESLGTVRSARFFVLPNNRVRYEIEVRP